MIEQVRLFDTASDRVVFAFGSHPMASDTEEHAVTAARADGNKLRIIMDELLRGNNLEEIQCRGMVDNDTFDRVPLGATPDDIARCASAQDVLPARCPASNPLSMCICKLDGGCPTRAPDNTLISVPKGQSVGVQDSNQDGAVDKTQFIAGAANVTCGGIVVPTDVTLSYWTPSGNQQKPAQGGFDALGPAVVLVPLGSIPTNMQCGVKFSPEVVDKDGNRVCAPADGDIAAGCTPGDTSAITFKVEPLTFLTGGITPQGQSRTEPVKIQANAALDAMSLANITVTEGAATPYTQFTATLGAMEPKVITITWTNGGLAAGTHYTITVPTTVTDFYKQPPLQPFQIEFTTL